MTNRKEKTPFERAIDFANIARSHDETRYVLNYLWAEEKEETFWILGTDGRQLNIASLPKKYAPHLIGLPKMAKGGCGEGWFLDTVGRPVMVDQGQFPKYTQIFPKITEDWASITNYSGDILSACGPAAETIRKFYKVKDAVHSIFVDIEARPDGAVRLTVDTDTAGRGQFIQELPFTCGPVFKSARFSAYFIGRLVMPGAITIRLLDHATPAVITGEDPDGQIEFKSVLMPVRKVR